MATGPVIGAAAPCRGRAKVIAMVPSDELERHAARSPLRIALVALLVTAAGAIVWAALQPAPPSRGDDRLPAFDLAGLGGGRVARSDFAGRPLVVNFWASWCSPCREEAPVFERAWRRHRSEVAFLGVNVCDLPGEARAFADEFDITYPLARDPDRKLAERLGVTGCRLPVTVFVEPSGRFSKVTGGPTTSGGRTVLGALSADELEAAVDSLVDGRR